MAIQEFVLQPGEMYNFSAHSEIQLEDGDRYFFFLQAGGRCIIIPRKKVDGDVYIENQPAGLALDVGWTLVHTIEEDENIYAYVEGLPCTLVVDRFE